MIRTNVQRTNRALAALEEYCAHENERGIDLKNPEDTKETMTDLLADLHHLLAAMGDRDPQQAMDELLISASSHYQEESHEAVP